MSASNHASRFLYPIDPRYTIRKIGKAIFDAAESDPEFADMLDAIQRKLGDGRSIISEQHGEIFDRIKCAQAIPNIPTAPDWLRPLVAAAYL